MSFSDEISNFVKKSKSNADVIVRKTVLDIGKRLVDRTPVGDIKYWQTKYPPSGYVGGHARANWSHSEGTRVIQEFEGVDKTGEVSNKRILASVPVNAAGKVHYIQNSVPYIEALEDGHSRQAPNGMVALTATEFDNIISEQVNQLKRGIS